MVRELEDSAAGAARRKKLNFVIAFALVALVLIGFVATSSFGEASDSANAVVRDSDGKEYTLPLSEDATLDVQTGKGWNRVVVEDGAVRVEDADCPNRDCVDQGAISKAGQQIVCLPHQLIVSVSDSGGKPAFDVQGS